MTRPNARVRALPPYPLLGMKETRRRLEGEGVDVIDLGAGDSDLPPPPGVVERLREVAGDPAHGRYGFQSGLPEFREAVASWMAERFGVSLDPWTEILPLIGSKEGIAHLPLGILEPGDWAVMPDPGYQAYLGGVLLAGGRAHRVPLRPEHDFLIPLEALPPEVASGCRMLILNYPNNPTTAVAPDAHFQEALEFCRDRDAVLVHDAAYSEIAFDGYRPRSVLEFEGGRERAIEFHSFSKTYNMTGWRLGWAAGSAELISLLARVKSFVDTGPFLALQAAGVAALEVGGDWVARNVETYRERRNALVSALAEAGLSVPTPKATMYVWAPVPTGEPAEAFAGRVLEESGVIVLPGSALGPGGEGYVRMALTVPPERLREAAARIAKTL